MFYIFHAAVLYTTAQFSTTAQSLACMLLHVSATYCRMYNIIRIQAAYHVSVNGKHTHISIIQQSIDVQYY
jgi:hypothetical protein